MNSDEFAAREQLAHVEQNAIKEQLASGSFANLDLTMAIRTPADAHSSIRASDWWFAAIDSICGRDQKFLNRAEFIRHYGVVGLAIEKELAGYNADMDPAVIKARGESHREFIRALDESIELAALHARGEGETAQFGVEDLNRLRVICEKAGYITRLTKIDQELAICGYRGLR